MARRDSHGGPDEISVVQNPALGAYAVWRFGIGHQKADGVSPPLPMSFLVLPMVLHAPTLAQITQTMPSSGLSLFASKLGKERDNLLAVHVRARALRQLSLESIAVASAAGLTTLDYAAARMRSNEVGIGRARLPERLKPIVAASEKLGRWFAVAGLQQVASTLAVHF